MHTPGRITVPATSVLLATISATGGRRVAVVACALAWLVLLAWAVLNSSYSRWLDGRLRSATRARGDANNARDVLTMMGASAIFSTWVALADLSPSNVKVSSLSALVLLAVAMSGLAVVSQLDWYYFMPRREEILRAATGLFRPKASPRDLTGAWLVTRLAGACLTALVPLSILILTGTYLDGLDRSASSLVVGLLTGLAAAIAFELSGLKRVRGLASYLAGSRHICIGDVVTTKDGKSGLVAGVSVAGFSMIDEDGGPWTLELVSRGTAEVAVVGRSDSANSWRRTMLSAVSPALAGLNDARNVPTPRLLVL